MMDERRRENQIENDKEVVGDMEILNMEPVVKEFVRRTDTERTLKRKKRKRKGQAPEWLWLVPGIVVLLAVILAGIFWLKLPVATVLLTAVLESALAICLCRGQLWLHGAVLALHIVLGLAFPFPAFMVLCCVLYGAWVWALHMWREA